VSWFVLVSVTLWIVVSFSGQERSTKSPELNTNALRPKSTFGSKHGWLRGYRLENRSLCGAVLYGVLVCF